MVAHPNPFRFYTLFSLGAALALALTAFWGLGWAPLAGWLVAVNLWTPVVWGWDKWQSRRDGRRIPEATLHTLSIVGGAAAALASMQLFRHKTYKKAFTVGTGVILALQLAIAAYWMMRTPEA